MKILWFPRLQFDIDNLHITTWREMCRELENLGLEVRLAVAGKDSSGALGRDYIRIPVIRIKFLRLLTFWTLGWIRYLQSYFSFKPDVIILDLFSFFFSFPFVVFPKRKRIYIIDHRTPMYDALDQKPTVTDRFFRLYTKLCFLYSSHLLDGITVITEHYKRTIHLKYGLSVKSVAVWGSGVNLSTFSINAGAADKFSGIAQKLVLMQHGNFTPNRGLCETVEAMKFLRDLDIDLVLAGGPIRRNETLDHLSELVRKFQLQRAVHILPPVHHKEVPKLLSSCDCAILAYPNIEYWNNNNPIKLLEYLAMGKPVICTDMWTFRDVLGEKRCVIYLQNNRPETIAAAIRHCYENREVLKEWGKAGIEIIRSRFTWRHQARNLLGFIEEIKKSRSKGSADDDAASDARTGSGG